MNPDIVFFENRLTPLSEAREELHVEVIERPVDSSAELAAFREWFAAFDASAWDSQFEADVKAGKFDSLAEQALDDHAAGRSREL
jgi:hypothetical protein